MGKLTIRTGDLIRCNKRNGWGQGALYFVDKVDSHHNVYMTLVFGHFPSGRRRKRVASVSDCRKVERSELIDAKHQLEAVIGGFMNRDHDISSTADSARNMSKIRKTVDDGETIRCEGGENCPCGCRDFNGRG